MILTLLKKYYREIAIGLLILLLMASVRTCKNKSEEVQLTKNKYDSTYNKAVEYKLDNGQKAFRINTLEASTGELKAENILSATEIKNLRDQVGNLNHLVTLYKGTMNSVSTFAVKGQDTVLVEIVKHDTVRLHEKRFVWHGKWLTLLSVYNPVTDSLTHRYHYMSDFQIVSYRRGKNLFSRGDLVTDITFSDPSVSVGEFRGVVVKEAPPKWYQTTAFKVLAGVGLGMFLKR
jgi:hypothetical protein